jgi:hypothetical protein
MGLLPVNTKVRLYPRPEFRYQARRPLLICGCLQAGRKNTVVTVLPHLASRQPLLPWRVILASNDGHLRGNPSVLEIGGDASERGFSDG